MRIDKFLKNSRIIKRRTVAKEACESQRILLNGKVAKPGSEVEVGDIIEVIFGNNTLKIQVLSTIDSQKKEDAVTMYKGL